MKKVLFVINTLGGAGAEKALLELLKRFTPDRYEVDLYVLLEQGELISQVPGYVNILNRDYTAESVLSAEGKKKLNKKVFMRLFTHARLWKDKILPATKHQSFALCSPSSEEFRFQGFFSVGTLSYAWGKLYRREFLRNHQIYFADLSYAEDKLFNMQCYICDAKYAFLEDIGYIYRKNDMSVSWQYRPDSVENWFKLVYELKSWIEKKDKDPKSVMLLRPLTCHIPVSPGLVARRAR